MSSKSTRFKDDETLEFLHILREEGIPAEDAIIYEEAEIPERRIYSAIVTVDGEREKISYRYEGAPDVEMDSEFVLRTVATSLKDHIHDEYTEIVDIGNTEIEFGRIDGAWAECYMCKNRVTLERVVQQYGIPEFSEGDTFPQPDMTMPMAGGIEDFLRRCGDGERKILKYYLLGALREVCECSYGKYSKF